MFEVLASRDFSLSASRLHDSPSPIAAAHPTSIARMGFRKKYSPSAKSVLRSRARFSRQLLDRRGPASGCTNPRIEFEQELGRGRHLEELLVVSNGKSAYRK